MDTARRAAFLPVPLTSACRVGAALTRWVMLGAHGWSHSTCAKAVGIGSTARSDGGPVPICSVPMDMSFLNLPDGNVLGVDEDARGDYLQARSTCPPAGCVPCGTIGQFHRSGTRRQVGLDLPIHGKRVGIVVDQLPMVAKASTLQESCFSMWDAQERAEAEDHSHQ